MRFSHTFIFFLSCPFIPVLNVFFGSGTVRSGGLHAQAAELRERTESFQFTGKMEENFKGQENFNIMFTKCLGLDKSFVLNLANKSVTIKASFL